MYGWKVADHLAELEKMTVDMDDMTVGKAVWHF